MDRTLALSAIRELEGIWRSREEGGLKNHEFSRLHGIAMARLRMGADPGPAEPTGSKWGGLLCLTLAGIGTATAVLIALGPKAKFW